MKDGIKIPRLKPGVIAGSNPVNRLIDAHNLNNSIGFEMVDGEIWCSRPIPAVIVNSGPNGEADFNDERYWVSFSCVTNGMTNNGTLSTSNNSPMSDHLQVQPFNKSSSFHYVVPACNFAERNLGGHALNTDGSTAVIITLAEPDLGYPTRVRYGFTQGGSGLTQFIVTGLPNMSGGVVLPYVFGQTYSNVSQGSMNIAIGVMQAHDVGDIIEALPIGQITNSGTPLQYQTSNGATGTVTWSEGNYGLIFEAGCNQSGGTNASGGTIPNTLTYIPTTKAGVPLTTTPQSPNFPRATPYFTVTAATICRAFLSNAGAWVIESVGEQTGAAPCPSTSAYSSGYSSGYS
jgi:hypothetical protein